MTTPFAASAFQVAVQSHNARNYPDAVRAYRIAMTLDPNNPAIYCNLGAALVELEEYDEGLHILDRALELKRDAPEIYNTKGAALFRMGRIKDATALYRKAIKLKPNDWELVRNLLAGSMYADDISTDEYTALHRSIGRMFTRTVFPMSPRRHAKIRVGFLSSDLRSHAVANNLLPLCKRMDPDTFDLHFYAIHPLDADPVTQEFKQLGKFIDITKLDDEGAAKLIGSHSIDILVSCAGRLDYNRPVICSYRAAPIQISMYDPATSCLREMDYLIADEVTVPYDTKEWFSEEVIRLNPFYVVDGLSDLVKVPDINPSPSDHIRFASFCNPIKISPTCFRVWGAVLSEIKGSTLRLGYRNGYSSRMVRDRVISGLTQNGARPEQILIDEQAEKDTEFLARYNDVDVTLDPMILPGVTSTFQSLSMGVPVVGMKGDRLATNVGNSILCSVNISCAHDPDGYAFIAREIRQRYDRHELRSALSHSATCDAGAYASQIQELFVKLFEGEK